MKKHNRKTGIGKQSDEKLKVLMLGWEFPPYASGGLGTACQGLVKGLKHHDVEVTFILPKAPDDVHSKDVNLVPASKYSGIVKNIAFIESPVTPYMTEKEYRETLKYNSQGNNEKASIYGKNLFEEVHRYSEIVGQICDKFDFDVIHAHDWLTYQAGMNVKKKTGKPLVVHMHATEFDRTGGNGVNQFVYNLEKEGMHFADAVCPVSNFTKQKIMEHYDVPENKIHVVHNAVEFTNFNGSVDVFKKHNKVVLFLGRITLQKGPDYFVHTAKKILEKDPDVRFVVVGTGDMEAKIIEMAAGMGIGDKVLFSGFLRGEDIDRAFKMADVYVMPSVSEPFGITPLESMRNGTPCIISKQSGVSEVINHCLKVDFWDIDETANKIMGVLHYKALKETLQENGGKEVLKFNWNVPAEKCVNVYKKILENGR